MDFEEKTLSSEVVYSGKVITVERDDVELVDGKKAFREVARHPGGVVILAMKDAIIPAIISFGSASGSSFSAMISCAFFLTIHAIRSYLSL